MRSLKVYGINQKMLEAFVEVIRNNPDPLCINDKVFVHNQPVSPALIRSVRHKDFAKVFASLGIYNLVYLPGASENYDFIAKFSNGGIYQVSTPRKTSTGAYVNFTEAVSKVLLKTILFTKDTPTKATTADNTEDLIYEDNNMTPHNQGSSFMTFAEMPPGLAEAIVAAGIKPMTKEQWESINVSNNNPPTNSISQTDVSVVTDVVDKLK